ncbi:MAG: hypothetical protein WCQ95_13630 [Bacteroidota bacterium]
MKKLVLLLLSVFLFQSCIDIKETITMNADGSGNIELLVNMGKYSKTLNQQNQKFDLSFVDQIKHTPVEAPILLKSCKGISNIKTQAEDEKGIYSVQFDFKNTKSLNKAIYALFKQKKSTVMPNFIKVSKQKLHRINFAPFINKYMPSDSNNMMSDLFFQFINFESTYNFPRKVNKVSNTKAVVKNDGKTVILNYSLYDLLKSNFDYGITVKY